MKMKKLKYISAGLILALSVSSCKETLEVKPKDQIAAEEALTNILGVSSLLNTTYSSLRGTGYYGQSFKILPDIMADNIYPIPNLNSNRLITNSLNQPGAHMGLWGLYTGGINNANLVINAIPNVAGSAAEKNKILGEAQALRALYYWDMVKLYGYSPLFIPTIGGVQFNFGVPIVLTPTSGAASIQYPARNTVDEVYKQIEADLLSAESLLAVSPSGANYYMTKTVAQAILAKVYLYWGKYSQSATYADKVIAAIGSKFVTGANYANMYYAANNPEAIMEINFQATQTNGNESLQSYYAQYPGDYALRQDQAAFVNPAVAKVGYGDFSPTPELLALYEAGDVRRNTITPGFKGGTIVDYVRKWTPANGVNYLQHIPLMRISEMYLIRAEANLRGTTAIGATPQADLDKIRLRAGLASTPVTIAAILKERRIELAFEGDRWFDLLRLGMDIPKSTALGGSLAPISYANDFRILAPIPVADLAVNPNLRKNEGY